MDAGTITHCLANTLNADPSVRKSAEGALRGLEVNQGFCQALVGIIKDGTVPEIRLAASIALKNLVKKQYMTEDAGDGVLPEADRVFLKENIVKLMLSCPQPLQSQLSEVISLIGKQDFPSRWPSLLGDLKDTFKSGDFGYVVGALHTAHSLFKRYRSEMKSDPLWLEIKYVLENFAEPLTSLFEQAATFAVSSSDAKQLQDVYRLLTLVVKIFYSLNCQDLPEFFEDNMGRWMPKLLEIVKKRDSAESTKSQVAELKSQICFVISMYSQKYEEEFAPYLPAFVETVWALLLETGSDMELDQLAYNGISFLSVVAQRPQYKQLFAAPGVLEQITEKVILPNARFRDEDKELFEDNPEDYIRRDIEGSDSFTRRKATGEFIRSLCRNFESEVTQCLSRHIELLLSLPYTRDGQAWYNRSTAIFLITSLAMKGSTVRQGVTQVSDLINIPDFAERLVLPLLRDASEQPVLHADALKFVTMFRDFLLKAALQKGTLQASLLQPIVNLLASPSVVVHSYAANALERFIAHRDAASGNPLVNARDMAPLLQPFTVNAFQALSVAGSSENEYVMKAVMRVFALLQAEMAGFAGELLKHLNGKLCEVAKNPRKPLFNHYLFENVCVVIRAMLLADRASIGQVEAVLFPPFQDILKQDVAEFMPYVFQVLALMLSSYDKAVPPPYMALFKFLMAPELWERSGNATALVKLIAVYLQNGSKTLLADGQLNPILGVCQKLIASKAMDADGFQLLQALLIYVEPCDLEPVLKSVLILLFQRLQVAKTVKFVRSLIHFFAVAILRLGAGKLVTLVDSIQASMFGMVLEKIVLADLKNLSNKASIKMCSVGYTRLLAEDALIKGQYSQYWPSLLQSIVSLHEIESSTSEDAATTDMLTLAEKVEYTNAYNQLTYAVLVSTEPDIAQVQDARAYLAQMLESISKANPGFVGQRIGTVDINTQKFLQNYIVAAGVTIV